MSPCPSAPHCGACSGLPGCGVPLGANDTDRAPSGSGSLRGRPGGGGGCGAGSGKDVLGDAIRGRMPRVAHRGLIWRWQRDPRAGGGPQPSYSNPILSSTWYSTISPSSIFAVDFTTSIVRMLRTVFDAVATA